MTKVTHRFIATNGVSLHIAEAGPQDGPLVVLLHGFPEFWYGWRRQIPALATAGYHVVAPDQRGYNLSDKPPKVRDYATQALASDVVGLFDALGAERAFLVGHDWGGGVAWTVAEQHPERLRALAVLNCPHGRAFQEVLRKSPRQVLRSWYMGAFQMPWLPEKLLGAKGARRLGGAMRGTARRGAFSREDMEQYREAWLQPGALTAMINWYRAGLRYPPPKHTNAIEPPTLLIWGEQDTALGTEFIDPIARPCRDIRVERLPDASHWVQHEEPDQVNRLLLEFLRDFPTSG